MFTAEIQIAGQKTFLKACEAALKPEFEFETKRAKYSMMLNSKLKIFVEASDAVAFRAILNSISALLATAEQAWMLEKKAEEYKKT
ncbi:MAG: KEOPS complex subunit Pcc1 [Candidatus Nanoarchaeia archaeon]